MLHGWSSRRASTHNCTHLLCILKRLNSSLITFTFNLLLTRSKLNSFKASKRKHVGHVARLPTLCDLKLPFLLHSCSQIGHFCIQKCATSKKPFFNFLILIFHPMGINGSLKWSPLRPFSSQLFLFLPLNLPTRSPAVILCCTWSRDSINQISIGIQSPSVCTCKCFFL